MLAVDRRFDLLVDAAIDLVVSADAKLSGNESGLANAWAELVDQYRNGESPLMDLYLSEFEKAAFAVAEGVSATECDLLWPSCEGGWAWDESEDGTAPKREHLGTEVFRRLLQRAQDDEDDYDELDDEAEDDSDLDSAVGNADGSDEPAEPVRGSD